MEDNRTLLKSIVAFIFGALYISCLWAAFVFAGNSIVIPAIFFFVVISVFLVLLGLGILMEK